MFASVPKMSGKNKFETKGRKRFYLRGARKNKPNGYFYKVVIAAVCKKNMSSLELMF